MEKPGLHFCTLSLKNILINQGKIVVSVANMPSKKKYIHNFESLKSELKNKNKCKQQLSKVSNKSTRITKLTKWTT